MDASRVQNWIQDARPTLQTSDSFQDVPLTPLHKEDQSLSTLEGFPHVPLEHEIIASESAWDVSATPDEVNEQQSITSTSFSRPDSPTTVDSSHSEYSLTAVADRAQIISEVSKDQEQEESSQTSAVLNLHSDIECTSSRSTPGAASAVTLVEIPGALDTTSGPTVNVNKVSFSIESPRGQSWGPSESGKDISDGIKKSSDDVNGSKRPADISISIPSATVIAQATFSRTEKPETPPASSIPEFFEIPIPIFPFPAGTSRCTNRNCPIKGRHEKGPYLHGGKLRTRKGSIFGSSNPPPEIWFLYDMSTNEDVQGMGNKALAPVELFVKYHFGETRGEYLHGADEARESVQQGPKQGEKKSRFWS